MSITHKTFPGEKKRKKTFQGFSRVMTRPAALGRVRMLQKTSRAESGRVSRCSKSHGTGRVGLGSGQEEVFKTLPVGGSGYPGRAPPREQSSDP